MRKAKTFSLDQAEAKQRQAVTGLRNLGDDDLADEIESLSVEAYAERKGLAIANPAGERGDSVMTRRSRQELEEENDELWDKLENIYDELGDFLEEEEEAETEPSNGD